MFRIKNLSYLLLLLLVGCTGYEWNVSRADNLKIIFTYNDKNGVNRLDKYISSGELYIYNGAKELVKKIMLTKDDMQKVAGISLQLDEGDSYTAVCWANVGKFNAASNTPYIHEAFIVNTTEENNKTKNNDRLYFGSIGFELEENAPQSKVVHLDLSAMHYRINVIAKGFQAAHTYFIFTDLVTQFNFNGEPVVNSDAQLIPSAVYDAENNWLKTSSYLLKPNLLTTSLLLKSAELDEPLHIDLSRFVAENYPDIDVTDRKEEVTINIVIEQQDLSVEITIPDWEVEEGDIEIDNTP